MEAVRVAEEQAEQAFGSGILRALVAFRWLTIGWATIGVIIASEHVDRPWLAACFLALPVTFTALATWWSAASEHLLRHPAVHVAELAIGAAILLGDGIVFDAARAQSLPWAWPAAGIITVGIFHGGRLGACAGIVLGVFSYFGDARNSLDDWGVAASSKTALYVLGALVAAYVTQRLQEAEVEISAARARAEVARTLHDGVLQTLAVVQRRSTDTELADLARDQERELRDFLFGARSSPRSLEAALRETAAHAQKRFAVAVDVVAAGDLPDLRDELTEALAGAVGEALANAGKHAHASKITVYAEPDGRGVFCSVKDNGRGFDIAEVVTGEGLSGSIEGRITDVGGRATVRSRRDAGTDVQLWVGT